MELGSPEKTGIEPGAEGSQDGARESREDRDRARSRRQPRRLSGAVEGRRRSRWSRPGRQSRSRHPVPDRDGRGGEVGGIGCSTLLLRCGELCLEGEGLGVRELEFGRLEAAMTGAGAGSWEAWSQELEPSQGLGAESWKPEAVESIETGDGSESQSWEKIGMKRARGRAGSRELEAEPGPSAQSGRS